MKSRTVQYDNLPHPVLLDQPGQDTAGGVLPLARRIQVHPQHHVDQRGDRLDVPTSAGARVASLTGRRLADPTAVIVGLPPDARPLPSVTGYDELLQRRTTRTPAAPRGGSLTTEGQVS